MKIIHLLGSFLTCMAVLSCSTAPAQNASRAPVINERLQEYTKKGGPGLAYVVLKDGLQVQTGAFGYADMNKRVPITLNSRFVIGSLSKQITAMAILILEMEGKIDEESPASKYLPELPKYASGIKVRHLLHHQGGLADYAPLCSTSTTPVDNAAIMEFLRTRTKTEFTPGLKFQYSNTGYVVLAEIVRQVSGMSFSDFLESRIFKKLGMDATSLMTLKKEPEFQKAMHSYTSWPFFELNDESPCNYKQGPGSVVTNLVDFSKWMNGMASNALVPAEWTKKMFTPAALDDGTPNNYADGWVVNHLKNHLVVGHSGSWLSFRAYDGYVPDKNIWVAIFSNYEGVGPKLEDLGTELLSAFL